MSILGTRVLRSEDPRFLTSGGNYIEGIDVPGAAHVVFVQSNVAHGRIIGIDTAAARAMPGVIAIVTSADHDLAPQGLPHARVPADGASTACDRHRSLRR